MASTTAIRTAIKAALAAGFTDWQTSEWFLANPSPPSFDVRPDGTVYDTAMARGLDDRTFVVRAVVATTLDIGAQEKLDGLMDTTGAGSVKTVLETDKTLGGVISDLRVTNVSGYKVYPVIGATEVLGVEFTIGVYP